MAFEELRNIQNEHLKVRNILFETLTSLKNTLQVKFSLFKNKFIRVTIRTRQEILCLPYKGFFSLKYSV